MDPLILSHSLEWGLLLSGVMSLLIVGTLWLNAEMWLGDYPPDIRQKYGPVSARTRRQKLVFGILILAAPIVIIVLSLARLDRAVAGPLTLGPATLSAFITATVFNLFDLVVLDWLLFVRIQPRFVVLPGTEGLPGYRDYFFHFKAFLKGVVLTVLFSPVVAGAYVLAASSGR